MTKKSHDLTLYSQELMNIPAPRKTEVDLLQLDDLQEAFRVAWRRKWIILLFILLCLGGGWVYYTETLPTYRSSAQLLVVKKRPHAFSGMEVHNGYMEDDIVMHESLIKSPFFVSRVVEEHELGTLPSFEHLNSPINKIVGSLNVEREGNDRAMGSSSILKLSYTSPDPEDCQAVLESVITTYQEFLEETSSNLNSDALNVITHKAEDVQRDLKEKEAALQQFRVGAPALVRGADPTTGNAQLGALESQKLELDLRRHELQSRLQSLKSMRDSEAYTSTEVAAVTRMLDQESNQHRDDLLMLLIKEQRLLTDYGEAHPDVRAVRDEIAMTQRFLGPLSNTWTSDTKPKSAEDMDQAIAAYEQSMQAELDGLRHKEEALGELLAEQRERAQAMDSYQFEERQLVAEISRAQQFYETLIQQAQDVNLSKDVIGYSTNLIAPANLGGKVAPLPLLVFSVAGFLGLILGGAGAWFAESFDDSFRTSDEVRRRLGLPIVGRTQYLRSAELNRIKAEADGHPFDPVVQTYFRSTSASAEAYRAIRTALYFSTRRENCKVVQIASPNPGDGKTSMTANLAVSIAQSGKRVLLVDADLRNPKLHQLFGVSPVVGLSSVISETASLDECISETEMPNLFVLPCGPLPPNPSELLTLRKFEEIVKQVRQEYDYVLVDTPALLSVTDASVVAPRVDGVLLVIPLTKHGRPEASAAKEILLSLGATILGVVISGGAGKRREYVKSVGQRSLSNKRKPHRSLATSTAD